MPLSAFHPIAVYPRADWDENCSTVPVFTTLSTLYGNSAQEKAAYEAAKQGHIPGGDVAALRTVVRVADPRAYQLLKRQCVLRTAQGRAVYIVAYPLPQATDVEEEAPRRNLLPEAFASYMARVLGGRAATEIRQLAKVGRTTLDEIGRFVAQPVFTGDVDPNGDYLVVDDVFTAGGTIASLRSFIVRNGGSMLGCMALAHGTGLHQPLAITSETHHNLTRLGAPNLAPYWRKVFGHELRHLTEKEGQRLATLLRGYRSHGVQGDELLRRLHAGFVRATG